jgi:hypothetical protein
MFFYELTLQRALNGIDATAMMPTILNISNALLLAACFSEPIRRGRGAETPGSGSHAGQIPGVGWGCMPIPESSVHSTECSMTLHACWREPWETIPGGWISHWSIAGRVMW